MKIFKSKRDFAIFWTKVVVFGKRTPKDIENMSNLEMVNWAFSAVMESSGKILESWGIFPDKNLIDMIASEENLKKRAEMEKLFIFNFQQAMANHTIDSNLKGMKHSKWNSWPVTIRQNGRYNCAGASILGVIMLRTAGIKVHTGLPVGHVVNPVELSDGSWAVLDINCARFYLVPDVKFIEIGNTPCLDIKKIPVPWNIIPVMSCETVIAPAIGNLSIVQKIGQMSKDHFKSFDGEDIYGALEIYHKYEDFFKLVDLWKIRYEFFPEVKRLYDDAKYKEERKRYNKVMSS